MSAAKADAWLAALRSGHYEQGTGSLKVYTSGGIYKFCCLGVLQDTIGEVENRNNIYLGLPTTAWAEMNNINFYNGNDKCNFEKIEYSSPIIAQYRENNGAVRFVNASALNDDREYFGMNFGKIADLLEHCIERI